MLKALGMVQTNWQHKLLDANLLWILPYVLPDFTSITAIDVGVDCARLKYQVGQE